MNTDSLQAPPIISVIVATHNRRALLQRTLDALCVQTYPLQRVEIIVVADGCDDGTSTMLHHYRAPCMLHIIEQPRQGVASARNRGAAQASGLLLLFLDDDVEPTPTLIEAHIEAHQQKPGRVVLGLYPPARQRPQNFFQIQLQAWWDHKFGTLCAPGHRFTYKELLGGNLSLESALFTKLGGFDHTIRNCGGEDYELGVRLIKSNVDFTVATDAIGYHHIHETTDLDRMLQRARQEGQIDVVMGQQYPELRFELPLAHYISYRFIPKVVVRTFVFMCPLAGNWLATCLRRVLAPLEYVRLYHYWQLLYRFLHGYWYWRGVADRIDSDQALVQFLQEAHAHIDEASLLEIDLRCGLEDAERRLDETRPMAARIRYGEQSVGLIPSQPGAERLRGVHLRPMLAHVLTLPLLKALVRAGVIASSEHISAHELFESITSKSNWFGPTDIHTMWYEQYEQWNQCERRNASQPTTYRGQRNAAVEET